MAVTKKKAAPRRAVKKPVDDITIEGAPGLWTVIQRVESKRQRAVESTDVLEIPGQGCVVRSIGNVKGQIGQAMCFVPDVRLRENEDGHMVMVKARN